MSFNDLLFVSFGLAMDAFAVAIAAGLRLSKVTPRQVFRLAFHFGLFQWMMPILGYLAGSTMAEHIRAYDHWAAFALLSFVGGKMLWDARKAEDENMVRSDPTRGLTLVTLSVATSVDALAIGLSMAFSGVSVWWPAAVIGLVAGALTAVGITFGRRLGALWEQRAEFVGGCVLIAIGLRLLVGHLIAEHAIH
jgi:putative Mn2+ efflux pump MntP